MEDPVLEATRAAHQLAEFGRRTKTAEALAMSALMIAKIPIAEVELPKDEKLVGVSVFDPNSEANALLVEAKKMAPNNKAVSEMAETVTELLKERSRAVVLASRSGTRYAMTFTAGAVYTVPKSQPCMLVGVSVGYFPGSCTVSATDATEKQLVVTSKNYYNTSTVFSCPNGSSNVTWRITNTTATSISRGQRTFCFEFGALGSLPSE